MANQKKSQQAKKIEAMGKKAGATKAQVAQGLARAGGKSSYNVTNKDVKRAGQAAKIIAGAAVTAAGPGKVVKGVQAASKIAKAAKANKSSRQTGDIVISGKSAKNVVPKMGTRSTDISENVSIKNAQSPSGKVYLTGGAGQVFKQNTRSILGGTKAEAKANARGLKAANKPTNKTGSAMNKLERKSFQGKNEMIKSMQNTERAGLSKSSRKTTKKK
jgi:hypothetical protein